MHHIYADSHPSQVNTYHRALRITFPVLLLEAFPQRAGVLVPPSVALRYYGHLDVSLAQVIPLY